MDQIIIGECPTCGGRVSGRDPRYFVCMPCEMRERNRTGKTLD